jgi:hypothetical protein
MKFQLILFVLLFEVNFSRSVKLMRQESKSLDVVVSSCAVRVGIETNVKLFRKL